MENKITEEALEAWVLLHRTQRLLLENVEKNLKKEGLSPLAWYDVLLELRREKKTGLRQYEIGNKILLNKYNLSRLIDRLEKNNLIERHPCIEDGRGNRITITDEGEEILKNSWPTYSFSIKQNFENKLEHHELIELSRILNKLIV